MWSAESSKIFFSKFTSYLGDGEFRIPLCELVGLISVPIACGGSGLKKRDAWAT
jgi:hypothetical protein